MLFFLQTRGHYVLTFTTVFCKQGLGSQMHKEHFMSFLVTLGIWLLTINKIATNINLIHLNFQELDFTLALLTDIMFQSSLPIRSAFQVKSHAHRVDVCIKTVPQRVRELVFRA